jgi:hypothetical protein
MLENAVTTPDVQVRVSLRHSWIAILRFPLTEVQAEALDRGDEESIRAANPIQVSFSKPMCERCEFERRVAPDSCPGEPVSHAPDGTPQFM